MACLHAGQEIIPVHAAIAPTEDCTALATQAQTKKKGRPLGSKNKPKGDGARACHAIQAIFLAYRDAAGAPGTSAEAGRTAPPQTVPTRSATVQPGEGAPTPAAQPEDDLSPRDRAVRQFHAALGTLPQPTKKIPDGQPLAYPRLPEGALHAAPLACLQFSIQCGRDHKPFLWPIPMPARQV